MRRRPGSDESGEAAVLIREVRATVEAWQRLSFARRASGRLLYLWRGRREGSWSCTEPHMHIDNTCDYMSTSTRLYSGG